MVAAYDRALAPARLTATQLNVLITIAQVRPANVKTLARHVGTDPSTMPRLIAPLVRDGLVRLAPGADRRHRMVGLTAAGERRLAAALPLWDAAQSRFVSHFGVASWRRLRAALDRAYNAADRD